MGETIWSKIVNGLIVNAIEIPTVPSNNRQPLWFQVNQDEGNVFVENAKSHSPSAKMSKQRKINKKDFLEVYSYYHRWKNGERYLRQEVRLISRNTAYIFALIAYFERII